MNYAFKYLDRVVINSNGFYSILNGQLGTVLAVRSIDDKTNIYDVLIDNQPQLFSFNESELVINPT